LEAVHDAEPSAAGDSVDVLDTAGQAIFRVIKYDHTGTSYAQKLVTA